MNLAVPSLDTETKKDFKTILTRGPVVSAGNAINNEATPALGLAYIAGFAKKHGYNVEIVDSIAEGLNQVWELDIEGPIACQGLSFDDIVSKIPDDVKVIGISIMFSGEWPVQKQYIQFLKKKFPDALFIAGGEHITALTEFSLRDCPEIDVCMKGEGESSFLSFLDQVNSDADIRQTSNICYIDDNGEYIENGTLSRIKSIDDIPWPYWPEGYLEKFWNAGKSFGTQVGIDMPLLASRGCPYQCTFCSNPSMWTMKYILRGVPDVIAEIKHYMSKYKIDSLQFYDLTAITKKKWTIEFCEALIKEGIDLKWSLPSGTRSEALDEETLGLLKKTGCNYLVYAPESGSDKTLKLIKKRVKLQNLTKSIVTAKNLGIVVRANLIIGFPGETRKEMFKTIFYGLKLAFLGIDEVPINIYSSYPGSEIFQDLNKKNKVELNDKYFISLVSINSDFASLFPASVNEYARGTELAIYRLSAMLMNYFISYTTRPMRIIRTLRNVFGGGNQAATVLEHRLKDARRRKSVDSVKA